MGPKSSLFAISISLSDLYLQAHKTVLKERFVAYRPTAFLSTSYNSHDSLFQTTISDPDCATVLDSLPYSHTRSDYSTKLAKVVKLADY